MKAVVFLSVLIGVLLSLLIYYGSHYFSVGTVKNPHIRIIAKSSEGIIRTFCYGSVEYLLVNANGTAIVATSDANGKPLKCNY